MPEETVSNQPSLVYIDVASIEVPPELDRWRGTASDLALMRSIEVQGLLQPVGVRPRPEGGYVAVFGTRRIGAQKRSPVLREKPIAAFVLTAERTLRGTLDENALRRQLDPYDKVRFSHYAMTGSEVPEFTQKELAKSLGVSETWMSLLARTWDIPELWARIEQGTIPVGAAVEIAALPEDRVRDFLAVLDRDYAGAPRMVVKRLAREWKGEALSTAFEGNDLAPRAPDILRKILEGTPGVATGKLDLSIEWDKKQGGTAITVRLPYSPTTEGQIRDLIAEAQALAAPPPPPVPETGPEPAPIPPPGDARRPPIRGGITAAGGTEATAPEAPATGAPPVPPPETPDASGVPAGPEPSAAPAS